MTNKSSAPAQGFGSYKLLQGLVVAALPWCASSAAPALPSSPCRVSVAEGVDQPGRSAPSFSLSLTEQTRVNLSVNTPRGSIPIAVQAVNGFAGTVSFQLDSASGSTNWMSWSFSPPRIKGSGTATLTFTLTRNSGQGYPNVSLLNFSACSGGVVQRFSVMVTG